MIDKSQMEWLTLTDEKGIDQQFAVVNGLELNGFTYAVLVHEEEFEKDTPEAIILKYNDDDDCLEYISDDQEWEAVVKAAGA